MEISFTFKKSVAYCAHFRHFSSHQRESKSRQILRTHGWFHKYQHQTPSAKDDNTGTSHPPLREQFRSDNDPAQNNRPPVSAPEGCVVIWAWVSLPFLCLAFPSGHSRPRGDPDRHPMSRDVPTLHRHPALPLTSRYSPSKYHILLKLWT